MAGGDSLQSLNQRLMSCLLMVLTLKPTLPLGELHSLIGAVLNVLQWVVEGGKVFRQTSFKMMLG